MSNREVGGHRREDQLSEKSPAERGSARFAVWQGFAGSLMLLLGSFGVGWLASSSSLVRTWLLIVARTTPTAVIISTLLLSLGAFLMLHAWLRLYQHLRGWDESSGPILRWALILWTAPMMVALPLFSRDSYAYIGQGRLMQQGLNPYTNGISALSNYFNLGPDKLWTEAPTPYGPVWLWIEQGAVALANGSPELALIPFRLASLAGIVLLAIYAPKLAARYGFNPHRTLWLVVLNPVLLINFIGSVHNDSLMLGLVVAGVYAAAVKRPIWGIVLVTLSIAIKPITLIAMPFVGLLWAGHRAGWGRKFGLWAATLGISMAIMTAMGLVNGLGFGWLAALQTPGAVWIWYAPVGLFAHTVGFVVTLLGGGGAAVTAVIQTIGQGASILIVIALALVKIVPTETDDLGEQTDLELDYSKAVVRRMAWAFAAVVLLAPMIQPWYVLWLLAFFAVTGIKDNWQLLWTFSLTVFFIVIALTDQLSVFPWIPEAVVRGVAIAASLFGAWWIVRLGGHTRWLFKPAAEHKLSLHDDDSH